MTQRPIGLALGYDPHVTVREVAESAARAEDAGFTMAFFSETLFTNRDSVSALAMMAARTSRIELGATQVVKLRSPLVMAQSAVTLDELSGGRISIAVGAFTKKHALRNGVPLTDPIPTLNEYLAAIRGILSDPPFDLHGETFELEGGALSFEPLRSSIPFWVAATSKRGLANAGRVADGILLDAGASPEYSRNAIALVHESAREAGRDPSRIRIAQLINTSIESTREEAISAIRWEVASKFTYRTTPRAKLTVGEPVIDRDDLAGFAAAYAAGGRAELAGALPESYVLGLTATGTADDVRARVQEYRDAGVHLPLVRPAALRQLDVLIDTFRQ